MFEHFKTVDLQFFPLEVGPTKQVANHEFYIVLNWRTTSRDSCECRAMEMFKT
jgi:hypothetical protein